MLEVFDTFYAQPKTKAATLSLCLISLLFIVPLLQRKVRSGLTERQKELYDPIASDILAQVLLLFGGVIVYTFVALMRSDVEFVVGDALPFISVLGPLTAFWNIRRAAKAIQKARITSNVHRGARLDNVYEVSLVAYTAGLVSFVYGLIVLGAVFAVPKDVPTWLWFVSFLMTGPVIYSLAWSVSALAVASEYAANSKLGSSNPTLKRTRRSRAA